MTLAMRFSLIEIVGIVLLSLFGNKSGIVARTKLDYNSQGVFKAEITALLFQKMSFSHATKMRRRQEKE